jgi:mRNA interferase RelE/StbE
MYEVFLESRAERDLRRLPAPTFARIIQAVQALAQNPRPPGCRKIVGSQNDWRIRIGDYRVIFEIVEKEKAVRVMRVRHRREAYR